MNLKSPSPFPYWVDHSIFALIVAVILWPLLGLTAGLAAGAFFYVGREFTQWEQGGGPGLPFDWPGLAAPAATCALAIAAIFALT